MHSSKGNWVSVPAKDGKVKRRGKAKPSQAKPSPWHFPIPDRRDLPIDSENFFLWFLMRRGANLRGLHTVSALCAAVTMEIRAMERELEAKEQQPE